MLTAVFNGRYYSLLIKTVPGRADRQNCALKVQIKHKKSAELTDLKDLALNQAGFDDNTVKLN